MNAIYLSDKPDNIIRVYTEETQARIASEYTVRDGIYRSADLSTTDLRDTEVIFSTWGMPALSDEEISTYFPRLRAVFYAAGSVQAFARPFIERGIRIFSAWQANALPVVEYAVAQILLANKGFYQSTVRMREEGKKAASAFFKHYPGNYNAKVGILGDGAIGAKVIRELLRHRLTVLVFSITMTTEEADALGVRLASLEEIFAECDVISNHLANNDETAGMISRPLLERVKPYTTFINTGRGRQVDESALIDRLRDDPTFTAVLDVTYPEPPIEGSPLYTLPNVFLTPHIAGSAGNEVGRMGEYMQEEAHRFCLKEEPLYEVTAKMLETMA